jgi:hypothetical protein
MRISALHEECEKILASATGDARLIFELGQPKAGGSKVNWVIYWLLWQAKDLVTRKRRNNPRDTHLPPNGVSLQAGGKRPRNDGERVFWDPARSL